MKTSLQTGVYESLTASGQDHGFKDIPEDVKGVQPKNFLIHAGSLAATKIADGLVDPKLVLSWLLGALGTPGYIIGLIVPVREAGALLPQLLIAGAVKSLEKRKWAWVVGSVIQGLSVASMVLWVALFEGVLVGWLVVGSLLVFALGRSLCSVSYKDTLGKTLAKSTRGTATGTAATVSSITIVGFGLLLGLGIIQESVITICGALLLASVLWFIAAASFSTLKEAKTELGNSESTRISLWKQYGDLRDNTQLKRFILVRSLLVSTALAPPYLLAMAGRTSSSGLGSLGLFVSASAFASVVSSYGWGRLADVSSRWVLILAAVIGTVALAAAALLGRDAAQLSMGNDVVYASVLFVLMVAYHGVRLGRSTHIVDMADEDTRAVYTAWSNTIVGVVILLGGFFGVVADMAGEVFVLAIFACFSATAIVLALGLEEVQQTSG